MVTDSDAAKKVLQRNQGFYRAFESLDIGEMEQVWARDEEVKCVHPGWGLLTGWDDVMNSWSAIFDNTTLMQFRITNAQVFVSEACAWVTCMENITSVVDANVSETTVLATNIFVNQEGRWLMVHHHGSPVYRT